MQPRNKLQLDTSDRVIDTITARGTEVETGARNIDFILRGTVMPMLSNTLLERMSDATPLSRATLDIDEAGQFTATFA